MNLPLLIILIGLPGSGKSTRAKNYLKEASNEGRDGIILSTDDYWSMKQIAFDVELLAEAHAWNQGRAYAAVQAGLDPIVIDNTNMTGDEQEAYYSIPQRAGKEYAIVTRNISDDASWLMARCLTSALHHVLFNLIERSSHPVPLETMFNMMRRWVMDQDGGDPVNCCSFEFPQFSKDKRVYDQLLDAMWKMCDRMLFSVEGREVIFREDEYAALAGRHAASEASTD